MFILALCYSYGETFQKKLYFLISIYMWFIEKACECRMTEPMIDPSKITLWWYHIKYKVKTSTTKNPHLIQSYIEAVTEVTQAEPSVTHMPHFVHPNWKLLCKIGPSIIVASHTQFYWSDNVGWKKNRKRWRSLYAAEAALQ